MSWVIGSASSPNDHYDLFLQKPASLSTLYSSQNCLEIIHDINLDYFSIIQSFLSAAFPPQLALLSSLSHSSHPPFLHISKEAEPFWGNHLKVMCNSGSCLRLSADRSFSDVIPWASKYRANSRYPRLTAAARRFRCWRLTHGPSWLLQHLVYHDSESQQQQ